MQWPCAKIGNPMTRGHAACQPRNGCTTVWRINISGLFMRDIKVDHLSTAAAKEMVHSCRKQSRLSHSIVPVEHIMTFWWLLGRHIFVEHEGILAEIPLIYIVHRGKEVVHYEEAEGWGRKYG